MKHLLTKSFVLFSILSVIPMQVRAEVEVDMPIDPASMATETTEEEGQTKSSPVNINYFGIFYGPSVNNPSSHQPNSLGNPDPEKPLIMKNFLGVGHDFTENVSVIGTAYWIWQPVLKQSMQIQDPFLRVTYNSIYNRGGFNIYGDVRGHFPVTDVSRQNDLKFGLQTFQAFTYEVPSSRFIVAMYASQRGNFYGANGYGNDVELYFAPNISYQMTRTVALTALCEFQRDHTFGAPPFPLLNDGTDIAPGVSWDITPQINVNPYLNIMTDDGISLSSTSFGMMVNVVLL